MVKILDHVDEDSTCTPYLAVLFHVEFIQQIHEEFSHLSYLGLLGVIQP